QDAAGVVHPAVRSRREPRQRSVWRRPGPRGVARRAAGGHHRRPLAGRRRPMTARNRTPDRYRAVSLAEVDVPLTEAALRELLLGRDAYRRTRFIVVRRGPQTALVEVEKETTEPLFSPITDVRLLAGADECAVVDAPDLDPAVPSDLATAARRLP